MVAQVPRDEFRENLRLLSRAGPGERGRETIASTVDKNLSGCGVNDIEERCKGDGNSGLWLVVVEERILDAKAIFMRNFGNIRWKG
ncbi:hypothetical protein WN48_04252 [Eufriesea mexicana]|uniref:Uncharacterized protein n=1 Tax=Eufriesea mexicana TaxID=516756 RepID=A0A310SJH8_9HYME|nr:hypothetical protein WN48_04252 [Eufriesea mexicana]